jgi:hypothetical protein
MSAPVSELFTAQSGKETDAVSLSASEAELRAFILRINMAIVIQGTMDEFAGYTLQSDEVSREVSRPHSIATSFSNPQVINRLSLSQPVEVAEDNKALVTIFEHDVSNQARRLRRFSRWLNFVREEVVAKRITVKNDAIDKAENGSIHKRNKQRKIWQNSYQLCKDRTARLQGTLKR